MTMGNDELRRAELVSLSLLAVKSSNVIKSVVDGHAINDRNREILSEAEHFLKEVASGARFISDGKIEKGFSPSRSVRVLSVAMEPLKQFAQDDDVAEFFLTMSEAVRLAKEGKPTNGSVKILGRAIKFFDKFYDSTSKTRRLESPIIGRPKIANV